MGSGSIDFPAILKRRGLFVHVSGYRCDLTHQQIPDSHSGPLITRYPPIYWSLPNGSNCAMLKHVFKAWPIKLTSLRRRFSLLQVANLRKTSVSASPGIIIRDRSRPPVSIDSVAILMKQSSLTPLIRDSIESVPY